MAIMSDPVVPDDSTVPDHRPAPDSAKLAGQFAEWIRGETLVGRMLANLKTGRLPEVLVADKPEPEMAMPPGGGMDPMGGMGGMM